MAHTLTNLLVHVIFSTKDRKPTIDPAMKERLYAYMGGIMRENGSNPLVTNGPADHVHLFIAGSATIALADLLRLVKTNSSRWVHETWPERRDFAWQTGYGAFSVSESKRVSVFEYIRNQEEHHQKVSFQEEYLGFLQKNKIAYDERFLWT